MALLLLIVIGSSAGWLASVIARTEATGDVLRQIAFGVIASLIAGIVVNHGAVLGGLTIVALGAAIGVTFLVLGLYHLVMRSRVHT